MCFQCSCERIIIEDNRLSASECGSLTKAESEYTAKETLRCITTQVRCYQMLWNRKVTAAERILSIDVVKPQCKIERHVAALTTLMCTLRKYRFHCSFFNHDPEAGKCTDLWKERSKTRFGEKSRISEEIWSSKKLPFVISSLIQKKKSEANRGRGTGLAWNVKNTSLFE